MRAGSDTAGSASLHGLRAGLAHLLGRPLPADRRLLRRSAPPREAVLATLGPVELRSTRAGFVASTVVKRGPDAALQTALRRLADYTGGQHHTGVSMQTAKPVVQLPGALGTWLVRIGQPGVHAASATPMPCSGKVRIMAQPSEILAIIRLSGHPWPHGLTGGEAAIRATIAGSGWIACGPAMLRLNAPPGLLPWAGGFEVAIPVAEA